MSITSPTDISTTDHNILWPDGVRDIRLSFKARGVLVTAFALESSGERATIDALADLGRDGRTAIQSALVELTALGYRTVTRPGGARGTVVTWRWSL